MGFLLSFVLPLFSSQRDFLQHFSPSPTSLSFPVVLSPCKNGSPFFCQETAWVSITSISLCVCAGKVFTVGKEGGGFQVLEKSCARTIFWGSLGEGFGFLS